MTPNGDDAVYAAGSAVAGAVAGAGIYATIGGVGLAVGGTAVGVTLGPFVAIGTGLGLTGYGIYWLGKQVGASNHHRPEGDSESPSDVDSTAT